MIAPVLLSAVARLASWHNIAPPSCIVKYELDFITGVIYSYLWPTNFLQENKQIKLASVYTNMNSFFFSSTAPFQIHFDLLAKVTATTIKMAKKVMIPENQ